MKRHATRRACSLAGHISLCEAGSAPEFERVDLKTKFAEQGYGFTVINHRGYIPLPALDDVSAAGAIIAVVDLIADREPAVAPGGRLKRTRLIEMLSNLSTEASHGELYFHDGNETEKANACKAFTGRLDLTTDRIRELYLFGPPFTIGATISADRFTFGSQPLTITSQC